MITSKFLKLMTALLIVGGTAIAVYLLADHSQPNKLPGTAGTPATNPDTENLDNKVRAAIRQFQLTSIGDECLHLESEKTTSELLTFEIREIHNTRCGGDPETSPRLFNIQTDATGSLMWSDAFSDDGEMQQLKP